MRYCRPVDYWVMLLSLLRFWSHFGHVAVYVYCVIMFWSFLEHFGRWLKAKCDFTWIRLTHRSRLCNELFLYFLLLKRKYHSSISLQYCQCFYSPSVSPKDTICWLCSATGGASVSLQHTICTYSVFVFMLVNNTLLTLQQRDHKTWV